MHAKVFDVGSQFGIKGGRISKLGIYTRAGSHGKATIVNFDRGWDKKPETDEDKAAYAAILSYLEQLPPRTT